MYIPEDNGRCVIDQTTTVIIIYDYGLLRVYMPTDARNPPGETRAAKSGPPSTEWFLIPERYITGPNTVWYCAKEVSCFCPCQKVLCLMVTRSSDFLWRATDRPTGPRTRGVRSYPNEFFFI